MTWRVAFAAAAIGAILIAVFWPIELPAQERVDTAIVFCADMSDSIGVGERNIIQGSHALAIQSDEVISAIAEGQVGSIAAAYVEYSTDAKIKVGWTLISNVSDAAAFAKKILARPEVGNTPSVNMTAISAALTTAEALFAELPVAASRRVVDVMGDGKSNEGEHPRLARARLLAAGVRINALALTIDPAGVSPDRLTEYFADEIAGGPLSFTVPVRGIHDLEARLRQKLVLELF